MIDTLLTVASDQLATVYAAGVDVLAVEPPGQVAPPGSEKFTTVAGWIMWGIAGLFVLAGAVALAALAWAHHKGERSENNRHLAVIAAAAAGFGSLGQLMTPLIG